MRPFYSGELWGALSNQINELPQTTFSPMNTYFQYIDHVVLVLCFIITLINTVQMVRRASVPVRKVPAYFLVFGATAIATFMGFGHLFEISYHAVERAVAGTFVYDFRFYSLILMGMLLLTLSVYLLGYIKEFLKGVQGSRGNIIRTIVFIVAVSAPAGFFTPIAYMPSIACTISMLALPFVIKAKVVRSYTPTITVAADAV